ncbi:MAG: hypothetical protein ABSC23_03775 [Bryobacteraceae bacterium]|jgi:hypothetical protein
MSDTIGRIPVPDLVSSGLTFPLTGDQNYGFSQDRPVIIHRFGSLDAKQEQRFLAGTGPRKFAFRRQHLSRADRNSLMAFWEGIQGAWKSFTYNAPNPNGTTTPVTVTWEYAPISVQYFVNACQTGFNFIEVPASGPTYAITSTCVRFPSTALSSALASEVQQVIPLIHIRVRESAVPDIYLSDRRVTVGGQLYVPRLIGIGEQGSDVLISQDIKGSSDNVRFTFGNADRVMAKLANDTDLKYAEIDLCLFHVNSGILIQLWKGVIQNYVSDGTALFPVTCSDGFFQIMNQYPERRVSRQCWKTYNDGVRCPWATSGRSAAAVTAAGGDPASCDYYLESANGCQVHGMSRWFGGQQSDPQGVYIKDDSTGFLGFGRNSVTSTSIISETIWGMTLQEIWCNSGGNPLYAFMATPLMVAYRDESTFADSLGIVGAGPLGGFTASMIVQNADGYRYVVAPMVDGFTWQGFQVNGNLNITKFQPGMGLRLAIGNDPANPSYDYFSLGAGSPQVWAPNNYAAGVALCEMRIVKPSNIQPSTPDQHKMTVPVDFGLWGWTWDQSGNRTAVKGLINPFWVSVNMLLRALGLYGDPSTGTGPTSAQQLAAFVLSSLVVGDGSGTAEIAAAQVPPVLGGTTVTSYSLTTSGSALSGAQVNYNPDGSYSFQYYDGDGNLNLLSIGDAVSSGYVTATTSTLTETQFQFQGCIASQKPFRDWLTEVLNCGLGFYAWEFGKLKLGCRINASAVDSYTTGNILFQSLRLTPIESAFEHAVVSYADVAYQYQANTAEYCDKSHAAYYGRAGSPLTSQFHLVGCSSLSQGLRWAATRTREEVGGVTPMEWRNARAAAWNTTLLGLSNEVGQVVSLTHPEVPGPRGTCNVSGNTATRVSGDAWTYAGTAQGDTELINKAILINGTQVTITAVASDGSTITTSPAPPAGTGLSFQIITGCFRILKWTLKKDWSVEVQAQTVTASMYDLDVGPKPVDVIPAPMPTLFYQIPLSPAWAPYQIQAAANDALFPGEWTFDTNQSYAQMADGSMLANLLATGKLPVNEFSATGAGGPKIGSISQSATGGSLPANATLRVALCAIDSHGVPSAPSSIAIIGTSGSGTDTFTLNNITWPAVAGLASYVLFVSTQDDLVCAQATGVLTAGANNTYTPGSITFGGPIVRSTWALPSPYVSKIRLKAKHEIHGGVIGGTVESVSANTLVSGYFAAPPPSTNPGWTPVGRVISIIGRPEGATPYFSGTITAWNQSTGAVTVTPDPNGIVEAGDCYCVRFLADASNSANPTSVTDTGCKNNVYPNGMTPGAEVGNLIRVIKGASRGIPPRKITSNTATAVTWDLPMVINPGDVWIIEEPTWPYSVDTTSLDNGNPLAVMTINMPTNNFVDEALVIAGFTIDLNGNESPDGDAPIREDWIFGADGLSKVAGLVFQLQGTLGIESNAAQPLYLNGPVTVGDVKGYVTAAPTGAGVTFTIYVGGVAWLTLTIPAGHTSVVATPDQISALTQIPANTAVSVGITGVGTTFPGSNLSIFIYS